jgi:hypothetical protein
LNKVTGHLKKLLFVKKILPLEEIVQLKSPSVDHGRRKTRPRKARLDASLLATLIINSTQLCKIRYKPLVSGTWGWRRTKGERGWPPQDSSPIRCPNRYSQVCRYRARDGPGLRPILGFEKRHLDTWHHFWVLTFRKKMRVRINLIFKIKLN